MVCVDQQGMLHCSFFTCEAPSPADQSRAPAAFEPSKHDGNSSGWGEKPIEKAMLVTSRPAGSGYTMVFFTGVRAFF